MWLRADHVVLPGVGAFADCRRGLDGVSGMVEAMDEAVRQRGRPFLGICVGAQLMATRGLEHVRAEPSASMGSMASAMPGTRTGPRPGRP